VGIVELGNKLGISKGQASKLVAKGMPTHSVEAAHAWREIHAKPRPSTQKGVRVESLRPPEPVAVREPEPVDEIQPQDGEESGASAVQGEPPPPMMTRDHTAPEPDDDNNDPRQSLRRARKAELVGFNELAQCKRNGGSIEDIRKANSIYIAARNNRYKAEKDFKEWQRSEGILLFFDEARDIVSRPHVAVKQTLDIMPKTLAPRLFNQPQKSIEQTLADWVDNLTAMIRAGI
jgi:hypothetical protein